MKTLDVGDRAPDFTAVAHTGQRVSLADFHAKQVVVLYFYPKDGTPVCTAEACAFRDAYEDFAQAGAVVIGVSGDSLDRHRDFAERQRLSFLLLSDEDGALRKAFGVPKTLVVVQFARTFFQLKQKMKISNSKGFGEMEDGDLRTECGCYMLAGKMLDGTTEKNAVKLVRCAEHKDLDGQTLLDHVKRLQSIYAGALTVDGLLILPPPTGNYRLLREPEYPPDLMPEESVVRPA